MIWKSCKYKCSWFESCGLYIQNQNVLDLNGSGDPEHDWWPQSIVSAALEYWDTDDCAAAAPVFSDAQL